MTILFDKIDSPNISEDHSLRLCREIQAIESTVDHLRGQKTVRSSSTVYYILSEMLDILHKLCCELLEGEGYRLPLSECTLANIRESGSSLAEMLLSGKVPA